MPLCFQPTGLDPFGSSSFVLASRSQSAKPLVAVYQHAQPGAYFVPAVQLRQAVCHRAGGRASAPVLRAFFGGAYSRCSAPVWFRPNQAFDFNLMVTVNGQNVGPDRQPTHDQVTMSARRPKSP